MAQLPTPEELAAAQNALDEAARAESEAISALAVLGDPIYKNKVYRRTNLSEIRELQKIAKGLTSARKTAESTLKKVRQPIEDAKKQVSELRKKISPEDVRTGQRKQVVGPSAAAAQIADLERQISAAEGQPAPKPKDETKPAPTAAPKETTSAAQFRMAEEAQPGPTPTAAPAAPKATGNKKKKKKETGATEEGTTGEGAGSGTTAPPVPDWAKIVQEEFGPLWDVYNSNPDVKDVLDRSVQEGWFNDETKLSESLRGTGWYRTTERAARQFAIRQSTDPAQVEDEILAKIEDVRGSASANALSFDESTLRKLATDTIKYGWSEQQQLNALGSEAVAQARAGGARGVADLRSGFVGQDLRKTAAAYAQKPQDELLDSWITDIMTGKKTQEQWKDLMRSTAATQFRSLQPALDKGQDVTTAMFAYKQQASRILGEVMDTTDIDWTDSKWNPALNYRDPKTNEYRQMDLWEWNKYLRGMSEWQQTTEAKNVYGNVAMSLQNAFSTKGTGGATQ